MNSVDKQHNKDFIESQLRTDFDPESVNLDQFDRENLDVDQLMEQAESLVDRFSVSGLEELQKISFEHGVNIDPNIKLSLAGLVEEARQAKEILDITISGKVSRLVKNKIPKFIDSGNKFSKHLQKRIDDHFGDRLWRIRDSWNENPPKSVEEVIGLSNLYNKYKKDHESILSQGIDLYFSSVRSREGLEAVIAEYNNLPLQLKEKIHLNELFRQIGMDYKKSFKEVSQEQRAEFFIEKFKDIPEVIIESYIDPNINVEPSGEQWAEIINLMKGRAKENHYFNKIPTKTLSPEDFEKNKSLFFEAYLKKSPLSILYRIDEFKDLITGLESENYQEFINNLVQEADFESMLKNFKLLSRPDFDIGNFWEAILSKDGAISDLVKGLLGNQEVLADLNLTNRELIDIVLDKDPLNSSLITRLDGKHISLEDEYYFFEQLTQKINAVKLIEDRDFKNYSLRRLPDNLKEQLLKDLFSMSGASTFLAILKAASMLELSSDYSKKLIEGVESYDRTNEGLLYDALIENIRHLDVSSEEKYRVLFGLSSFGMPRSVADCLASNSQLYQSFSVEQQKNLNKELVSSQPLVALDNYDKFNWENQSYSQAFYKAVIVNSQLDSLLSVKEKTGDLLQIDDELILNIQTAIMGYAPTKFIDAIDTLKECAEDPDKVEGISWQETYQKLAKLQARSANEEHDPWVKELDPLVVSNKAQLDRTEIKHGDVLYDFVQKYGMYNLPTFLEWHKHIYLAQDIEDIPKDTRQAINDALGIKIEDLPNKGFITQEIMKYKSRIQEALLNDVFVEELVSSPVALELFNTMKGSTQWERNHDPVDIFKTWKKTATQNTELARLPEHYQEINLEINQNVRDSKPKTISDIESKILKNEDLVNMSADLIGLIESTQQMEGLNKWWNKHLANIEAETRQKLSILQEKQSSIQNEKAQQAMGKQIDQLLLRQAELKDIKVSDFLNGNELVDLIENLIVAIPDKSGSRKQVIQELSMYHQLKLISDQQLNRLNEAKEIKEESTRVDVFTQIWRDHLVDYVNEHYLNPQQELHHTNHKPFSKVALKELSSQFGIKAEDMNSNIFIETEAKLKSIRDQGVQISDKKLNISLVPAKGLLRVYSGDIGDACYTSQHKKLAEGEFPNLTAFTYVINKGTNNERLAGSVLVIETKTKNNEPVLLIRANNPSENLLGQVDSDQLNQEVINSFKELASQRGIKKTTVPLDKASQASSNRPKVSKFYQENYANNSKLELEDSSETNFNGYNVWDAKDHPAVEV